jgi:hypothetical protein
MFTKPFLPFLILALFCGYLSLATASPNEAAPPAVDKNKAPTAPQNTITHAQAAENAYKLAKSQLDSALGDAEGVYRWSVRWLNAAIDLNPSDKITQFKAHLTRMQELENLINGKASASGRANQMAAAITSYYRLEAEYWLTKAGSK